jgi:uncharacterized protein (DUF433 family)
MVILYADPIPLRVDETGIIRIGKSRVTLDVLIADYRKGWSAEEIVRQLDTLDLADVHFAIAYYLRHRDEIDEYLRQRWVQADEFQRKIEAEQPNRPNLKTELLARLSSQGRKSWKTRISSLLICISFFRSLFFHHLFPFLLISGHS